MAKLMFPGAKRRLVLLSAGFVLALNSQAGAAPSGDAPARPAPLATSSFDASPVNGFSHVAVGVRDIDRALEFYRDVIGLKVTSRAIKKGRNNLPDREAVYLRWDTGPATSFVVLDRPVNTEPFGKPAVFFQIGFHHIGFSVTDLRPIVERAGAHGMKIVAGPSDSDGFDFGYGKQPDGVPVVRTMVLTDPDGNIVQIDQWLSKP